MSLNVLLQSDQSKHFVVAVSVFSGDPLQVYTRQLLAAFTVWGPFPMLLCSHPSEIVLLACGTVGGAVQMGFISQEALGVHRQMPKLLETVIFIWFSKLQRKGLFQGLLEFVIFIVIFFYTNI